MGSNQLSTPDTRLPPQPIDRLVEPMRRFLHVESASGVVLLLCTVAALVLANSPWSDAFLAFWKSPIALSVGTLDFRLTLVHWINDGLMVIFFFVVGLEVKRELVLGELRHWRLAALPLAGALGGMAAPALIYLALQWGQPGEPGWGIPMATDIAFVVGCLALLGSRVPHGLRVFLLSLAIADDVGAILVIAIGYTSGLHLQFLAAGLAGILLVMVMRRLGVRSVPLYVVVGVAIWFSFHESGIHATIAGVILGLLTPTKPLVSEGLLARFIARLGAFLEGEANNDKHARHEVLQTVQQVARETLSPLERLETRLHPWVSFVIMPLFALANAGVVLQVDSFANPIALAVAAGLLVGKPLGIVLVSWLAVRAGLARLPERVTWNSLLGGGALAGIGFTMSLFIAGLALADAQLDAAKIGILAASALAAVLGMALLIWLSPRQEEAGRLN